jgi:hypothetical protein
VLQRVDKVVQRFAVARPHAQGGVVHAKNVTHAPALQLPS